MSILIDTNPQDHVIEQIRAYIPKLVGVRTDRIQADHGGYISPAVMIEKLHKGNFKSMRYHLSPHAERRNKTLSQIRYHEGLDKDSADEIYALMEDLIEDNPVGGWTTAELPADAVVFDGRTIDGVAIDADEYLVEIHTQLAARIPEMVRLELLNITATSTKQRRNWARFLDVHGRELAAIDNAQIALHIREGLRHVDSPYRAINLERMATWADQIGAEPKDMPRILAMVQSLVNAQIDLLTFDRKAAG